jgi:nickel superoxide dismutase
MLRPAVKSIASRGLRALDRIAPPQTVHAHCDIPCGIYDPHLMQIAALTVVRMNQLIDALEVPARDDKAGMEKFHNSFSRYVTVKEEHAELAKREVRIIWGDYFKPEHLDKFKDLHTIVWNILKAGGKTRQEVNLKAAEDLLSQVQRFAEIFWESKGVATKRQPSNQAVGGELVVPA